MPRATNCSITCGMNSSADSIDLLCAFIKLSGFEKFRSEIERHCDARRPSAAVVDHDVHGGVGCGCDRETGGVAECDGEDFVKSGDAISSHRGGELGEEVARQAMMETPGDRDGAFTLVRDVGRRTEAPERSVDGTEACEEHYV